MILIAPIYLDVKILPHFLRHYSDIGVSRFHFAINTKYNSEIVDQVEEASAGYPVQIDRVYEIDDLTLMVAQALNNIRLRFSKPQDWISVVDLDEFFELPTSLSEFLANCEKKGHDHVAGRFVDRVAVDGSFADLKSSPLISQQYPLKRRLTKPLTGGNDIKIVLQKGYCKIVRGHHNIKGGNSVAKKKLVINHYKWKHGVVERIRKRFKVHERMGIPWRVESRKFLDYVEKHGCIDIDNRRFFEKKRT